MQPVFTIGHSNRSWNDFISLLLNNHVNILVDVRRYPQFNREEMAKQFCRWDPELKIVGLRLSNVMSPEDYARFPDFQDDARKRKWNVWSYIDARDAAQAFRLALEADLKGAEVFIIANADTVMLRDNKGLLAEVFPDVPQNSSFGPNDSLFSIEKARQVMKYEPKYSWRTQQTK